MKRIIITFFIILIFLSGTIAFSCTFFKLSKRGFTLVGNNEDWKNPNTRVRFVPPGAAGFGVVYFRFDDGFPQGGMNDQGLAFDYMATAPLEVKNSINKKKYRGDLLQKIMRECASVAEALAMLEQYNLQYFRKFQLMLVDRNGESAIVEGDVTHKDKGKFQVCTNFYLSQLKKGEDYPCDRYKIANKMLNEGDVTVDTCRKVLAAVHQEGDWGGTQYSNIYDTKNNLVYLYHYHNFENVVVIDLKKEFKKGEHSLEIPKLFPDTYAAKRYAEQYNKK